jgi:predicted kinase
MNGRLIIVTGFLATLKSTISKRLGQDLNILTLNKDDIKEILGETIGFKTREENLKLSDATFKLMMSIAEKNLLLGYDVIIEANFKKHELDELMKSEIIKNSCVITLYLTGDKDILYERYIKRDISRHHVHQSTGLMTFDIFSKSMDSYQIDDCFGEIISYDTTLFNEVDYHNIFKQIKEHI